jgi:plastocyanin
MAGTSAVRYVRMRRGYLAVGTLVAIALLALALVPARRAATAADVSIQNFSYIPATITVAPGERVTWTNNERSVPHTVTSDSDVFDSGRLAPGATFSFTFTTPGTYTYHCAIHPYMHGTVVVQAGAATSTPAPAITPATPSPIGAQHQVLYHAGFNIVGVPSGATLSSATAIYALSADGSGYEAVDPGRPLDGGKGYWAYFTADTTANIPDGSNAPISLTAPAGQWLLVGDPSGTSPAMVTGADAVYTYDPVAGQYTATTRLLPGQGAWAISLRGGTITITPGQPMPTATATPAPALMATQPPATVMPSPTMTPYNPSSMPPYYR